ncbi:MFS general substrate transporter [Agrocybe pediades]|nr:MFS general substrate transporter [Agrocybe pediades]
MDVERNLSNNHGGESSATDTRDGTINAFEIEEKGLPVKSAHDTFPEGGYQAWATAFGAFLIQICGFGYTTSFGVFQDYYVRVHLTNESASAISWIGSVNAFLVIGGGIVTGRIYDKGYFYTLMYTGALLISFSLFMLSLTKPNHYYQVLLSQGFGVGIGIGMMYVPSIAILSHYFQRRRILVMTIVATGSSLGSTIHPIMLNNTLDRLGFPVASRANAGLISGLLLISCLLMRTRLPPPETSQDLGKALRKFTRDKAYVCCVLGFFFFVIGLYFPTFYLQLDSIKHGLSPSFSFYSLVIMNASSCIGRITAALAAAHVGTGNLVVGSTGACCALIFGMIGVKSVASVVIIAVFYGFSSGVYVSLMAPMVATLADDFSEIGLRMGIGFTLAGVGGLIGTPIDGALLAQSYHWARPAAFSGVSWLN